MSKQALLVGCNYGNMAGVPELKGSHKDVHEMRRMLMKRFGFESSCIQLMFDGPGSRKMPTGANIKKALTKMVRNANPGDVLFFHFSGRGTRLPKPRDRASVEAIVPSDANVITTVDFRYILGGLPEGAKLTIICDSCNTGALIDKRVVEIGSGSGLGSGSSRPMIASSSSSAAKTLRFISYEMVLQQLPPAAGADIGATFLRSFGSHASAMFVFAGFNFPVPLRADQGILLSDEFSWDNEKGNGEFSSAVVAAWADGAVRKRARNQLLRVLGIAAGDDAVSNRAFVEIVRDELYKSGVRDQFPCLYCSEESADAVFLCELQK